MINTIQKGKYPSKRQRSWLDQLISDGAPARPSINEEYISNIDEALTVENLNFHDTLLDFKGRLMRGWTLSSKQKKFCDDLITKAIEVKNGTAWAPSDAEAARIKLAIEASASYEDAYWYTHPGGHKAVRQAKAWADGEMAYIDVWTMEKLFKAVAGRLRLLENPKFSLGEKCFVGPKNIFGIILDGPKVDCIQKIDMNGNKVTFGRDIVYDVLVDGNIWKINNPKKRRS